MYLKIHHCYQIHKHIEYLPFIFNRALYVLLGSLEAPSIDSGLNLVSAKYTLLLNTKIVVLGFL